MRKLLSISGVLLLCFIFSGCSGNVRLEGRVTYSDNGEPLEQGTVAFYGSNFLARGEIRQDGRFVVGTQKDQDGLPPGTYRIAICADQCIGGDKYGMPVSMSLIDERYRDPEQSNLSLTVTASTKTYDLQVDRLPEVKKQQRQKLVAKSLEESEAIRRKADEKLQIKAP